MNRLRLFFNQFRFLYRFIALGLAVYFFIPFLHWSLFGSSEHFGGPWRYLTIWALVINLAVAFNACLNQLKPKIPMLDPLLTMGILINLIVVLLYWGLFLIDPSMVNGDDRLPLHKEIYLHLGMALLLWGEAFFQTRPYRNHRKGTAAVLVLFFSYLIWIEAFVFPLNASPCDKTGQICGLPYPFLNDLDSVERGVFYSAMLLVLFLLYIALGRVFEWAWSGSESIAQDL